jgi:hypothetical protein
MIVVFVKTQGVPHWYCHYFPYLYGVRN